MLDVYKNMNPSTGLAMQMPQVERDIVAEISNLLYTKKNTIAELRSTSEQIQILSDKITRMSAEVRNIDDQLNKAIDEFQKSTIY
jgi:molecular chaperone GrpE (heat shock protein)